MAQANNNFTLIGNLTKEPEAKHTANGNVYTFVSIAVNGIKDKPDFMGVIVWGKLAETIVKYCKKGDCVAFSGHISVITKDNSSSLQLTADDAKFLYKAKRNEAPKEQPKTEQPFTPGNDQFVQPTPDIFAPM